MLDLVLTAALVPVYVLGGAFAGTLLGFIPGLYLGTVCALYHSLIGFTPAQALGVAAAVGAHIYCKRVNAVFSPAAGSPDLASMDPGLKLTAEGRGHEAVLIAFKVVDELVLLAFLALLAIAAAATLGIDVKAWVTWLSSPLAWMGGTLWVCSLAYRSRRRPWATAAFVATGAGLGYWLTHHSATVGDVHALTPLLLGAFALPIGLNLLKSGGTIPTQKPVADKASIKLERDDLYLGTLFGLIGGVAVGVGASSLASTVEGMYENPDNGEGRGTGFFTVAVAAETCNDLVALGLLAFCGAGRSGEAVAIANITGQLNALQGVTVLVAAGVGLIVGGIGAHALASSYIEGELMWLQRPSLGVTIGLGAASLELLMMNSFWVGALFTLGFFIWSRAVQGDAVLLWWRRAQEPVEGSDGSRSRERISAPAQSLFAPFVGTAWAHQLGEDFNRWVLDTSR